MTLNDDRLRLAYLDAARDRAVADRGPHPDPEALLAVAERGGSEAARLEVLDHVMACEPCRRELDLVRASVAAAGAPRVRTWSRSPSVGLMALAALLLVVAGVRLYLTSRDSEAGPVLRGGEGVATYPVRWLPSVGAGLAWRPADGAIAYRLEIIDDAGRAVVDSTLRGMRDTSFVLVDSLVRGRTGLTWTVTATLGDGTTITSLPALVVPPTK
jgi:hypothetical protein